MIEKDGDRFYLDGPVTLGNVLEVLAEGERLFHESRVLVDLSRVTEADSSVLSLMLEWARRRRAKGGAIEFANLGEAITSLTDLYGVAELIPRAAE